MNGPIRFRTNLRGPQNASPVVRTFFIVGAVAFVAICVLIALPLALLAIAITSIIGFATLMLRRPRGKTPTPNPPPPASAQRTAGELQRVEPAEPPRTIG